MLGMSACSLNVRIGRKAAATEPHRQGHKGAGSLSRTMFREEVKEGFLLGKRWPKFAPYVTDIWRKSDFYSRHFAERRASFDHQARYAKYNDL